MCHDGYLTAAYPTDTAARKFHITAMFRREKMPTRARGYHLFGMTANPQRFVDPPVSARTCNDITTMITSNIPMFGAKKYAGITVDNTVMIARCRAFDAAFARSNQAAKAIEPSSFSRCGKCIMPM